MTIRTYSTVHKSLWCIILALVIFLSCKEGTEKKVISEETVPRASVETTLNPKAFDTIIDRKSVKLYVLENKDLKLAITNYGGRFVGLWVPDKMGRPTDVVVGMGSVKGFIEASEPYFGATIGRVGNRIARGKFSLGGTEYTLPTNNGQNTLHGGHQGFQYVVWDAKQPDPHTLILQYLSKDMEEGFPGNLNVEVTYSLTDNNAVRMEYRATTDKTTVVNLTNHAFFNLNGEGAGTILNHSLQLFSETFTPVDSGLIPTGELRKVEGTPFDFREPHTIGERIETSNGQLKNGGGYDHNFVLNGTLENGMNHAAKIMGDKTGIVMDIYTEEPGIQFYSGNFMESKNTFKSRAKDDFRTAFALETQHFPDAPNQPDFPSIVLRPRETYHTVSEYKFSIRNP